MGFYGRDIDLACFHPAVIIRPRRRRSPASPETAARGILKLCSFFFFLI